MSRPNQLAFGGSLILNLILIALLIINWQRPGAPEPAALAELPQPTPTTTPTIAASPTSQPTEPPTATATPLATVDTSPTATLQPSPTPLPTVEPTLEPTITPLPTATATPEAVAGPDWLNYLNLFRTEANLPPLTENSVLSRGAELHSLYMVKTDQIMHSEDINQPWFTREGDMAARNGNLAASDWFDASDRWAINYWFSAPFHGLPIIDPHLQAVGFGLYRERLGSTLVAATLDIKQGRVDNDPTASYPVYFPRDGGQTWVLDHKLFEYPQPLTSCPGYQRPSGPPIMLLLGNGNQTPNVTGSSFMQVEGNIPLLHCVFDETTYSNPSESAQRTGRFILAQRNAVILMPRQPLLVDRSYVVSITVNGTTHSWQFTAVPRP